MKAVVFVALLLVFGVARGEKELESPFIVNAPKNCLFQIAPGSNSAARITDQYVIGVGTQSGVYVRTVDCGRSQSCRVKGLESDTTYYLAVWAACDECGTGGSPIQSPASNEIVITPSTVCRY
jgi:hypothetical protein